MVKRYEDRITADPAVMVGKPVIRGTRITVEQVLRKLAQGIPVEQLLQEYPHITQEDIYACLEYATGVLEEEKTYTQ